METFALSAVGLILTSLMFTFSFLLNWSPLTGAQSMEAWTRERLTLEVKDIKQALNRLGIRDDSAVDGFVKDDGWFLAFRLTAGIGKPAWKAYTNTGYNDDDLLTRLVMPCGCLSTDGSLPCDRHYRSHLLDVWPSGLISKVKVALYEKGQARAYAIFNGKDSTFKNWMSKDRLMDSTWGDLNGKSENVDFLSVVGDADLQRRFFICNDHAGCGKEKGWMVVKDKDDMCEWGRDPPYPSIFYSPLDRRVNFKSNYVSKADVLAVWVKFVRNIDFGQKCWP